MDRSPAPFRYCCPGSGGARLALLPSPLGPAGEGPASWRGPGRPTVSRLVGGHPLSPRHCGDAGPPSSDLGAVPTSQARAELRASPSGFPGGLQLQRGSRRQCLLPGFPPGRRQRGAAPLLRPPRAAPARPRQPAQRSTRLSARARTQDAGRRETLLSAPGGILHRAAAEAAAPLGIPAAGVGGRWGAPAR